VRLLHSLVFRAATYPVLKNQLCKRSDGTSQKTEGDIKLLSFTYNETNYIRGNLGWIII